VDKQEVRAFICREAAEETLVTTGDALEAVKYQNPIEDG
jgi:hypothetical protein